jgi:hypothetical protein
MDHPLPARFSAWRRYHVRRDISSLSQGFLASMVLARSSIRGRPFLGAGFMGLGPLFIVKAKSSLSLDMPFNLTLEPSAEFKELFLVHWSISGFNISLYSFIKILARSLNFALISLLNKARDAETSEDDYYDEHPHFPQCGGRDCPDTNPSAPAADIAADSWVITASVLFASATCLPSRRCSRITVLAIILASPSDLAGRIAGTVSAGTAVSSATVSTISGSLGATSAASTVITGAGAGASQSIRSPRQKRVGLMCSLLKICHAS